MWWGVEEVACLLPLTCPSALWVQGVELGPPGLVVGTIAPPHFIPLAPTSCVSTHSLKITISIAKP